MKVLFVSPEVSPFARTGGLGEVVGSLPIALNQVGVETKILCPLHGCCKTFPYKTLDGDIVFRYGNTKIKSQVGVLDQKHSPVSVYFLINEKLFGRTGIYADEKGDYSDNCLRSFVLSHAATQIEKITRWKPDILHAHDWMAAATSAYLNAKQAKKKSPKVQGSVLTIHNLEHQGVFNQSEFHKSRLPNTYWGIDGFEHHGTLNLLKGGIQHADKISTVSPTYAQEIRTKAHGQNLEESLKFRGADLLGILNGIDQESWNPINDQLIPSNFGPHKPLPGKQLCKEDLIKEFKLANIKEPLIGVVSRLHHQKGLDLLLSILPDMLAEGRGSFIILGSGDKVLEKEFSKLADSFPERIGLRIGFDDALARRIFAGTDFFLMPSRFEPCGLAQQYAMRYGSIPVARNTGGLSDTIIARTDEKSKSTGYLFKSAEPKLLLDSIKLAIRDWDDESFYLNMQKRAMNVPSSWDVAAEKYKTLYNWVLRDS
ncbi:glycogen synthase GlgA [Opitutales bacterium]|nr:glycogen synthase GlgA [Opitutales bacterium]